MGVGVVVYWNPNFIIFRQSYDERRGLEIKNMAHNYVLVTWINLFMGVLLFFHEQIGIPARPLMNNLD